MIKATRSYWLPSMVILVLSVVAEAAGLRNYAGVISGTSVGANWTVSVCLCLLYLAVHFAAVVVAPILLIACGIEGLLFRRGQRHKERHFGAKSGGMS